MPLLGAILLTIGTLIVVVPTRDGVVIVADSKLSRRTTAGAPTGTGVTEKVFSLPGVPGTAFFVTGITPVEWLPDGGTIATVVDARGLVTARLSHRGDVSRARFDALADEAARIAGRINRMGDLAAALTGRELFSVVMVKTSGGTHDVASFVVRLTASGASVSERTWEPFAQSSAARVMMFGEGAFVGAGLPRWPGGSAECARRFLASGRRRVADVTHETAARGGYSILEAASIAMGEDGAVGPPFRTYLLTQTLTELRPPPPCR